MSASLLPGWNIVSVPFDQTLGTANLSFTYTTQAITPYAQATGTIIGTTIFRFDPDPVNPDLGTMLPATTFNPGEGYMVRALRPEGAVMVFTPTDFTLVGALRAFGSAPTTGFKWESQVEVRNNNGRKSFVVLGQYQNTVRGFDPRVDSELPPTPGGFQAAIVTDRPMYKEIGYWNDRDVWRMTVTGLTPGQNHTIEVTPLLGAKTIVLKNLANGKTETFVHSEGRYNFKATAETMTFEIKQGSRW